PRRAFAGRDDDAGTPDGRAVARTAGGRGTRSSRHGGGPGAIERTRRRARRGPADGRGGRGPGASRDGAVSGDRSETEAKAKLNCRGLRGSATQFAAPSVETEAQAKMGSVACISGTTGTPQTRCSLARATHLRLRFSLHRGRRGPGGTGGA